MRSLVIILFFVFSFSVFSQNSKLDQIYLKDGQSIKGIIVNIVHPYYVRIFVDQKNIEKYLYQDIERIDLNDSIRRVKDIIYTLDNEKIKGLISTIQPDSIVIITLLLNNNKVLIDMALVKSIIHKAHLLSSAESARVKGDLHYVSFAPGVGNSYGMLGWRFQYRYGGNIGLAVHAGVGIYPDPFSPAFYYNGGLKLMMFYWLYFDISYGLLHREYYSGYYQYYNKDFYGYSYMIGMDYFFAKNKGINVGIGIGSFSNKYSLNSNILKIDMGFILKIPIR